MAFPIPSHLPRRAVPQDVSSKILSKIDEATHQSLNASLAGSWVNELDETIQTTKERIHSRIHADLPQFEQQLESSKSIQTRLQSLTTNVDNLNEEISNAVTGLIPTLLASLTKHAALAQEAKDGDVLSQFLGYLHRCHTEYESVNALVEHGKLSEAVNESKSLDGLLENAPPSLNESSAMHDLVRKFRAAKARAEERLSNAYLESIVVSDEELTMIPSVQIRPSGTIISLSAVLSSLSFHALANHLNTLRRDLTSLYIDRILTHSMTIVHSGADFRLSCSTASPEHPGTLSQRIDNLSDIVKFLCDNLFAILPQPQATTFPQSLCRPITDGVLNNLLIPSLPSSFSLLPAFLEVLQRAVAFEQTHVIGLLGNDVHDTPIKAWADGVSGHYERQRRQEILEMTRTLVITPEDSTKAFVAEIDAPSEPRQPDVVPIQVDDEPKDEFQNESWGFDDEQDVDASPDTAEDGWGFDDDDEPVPEAAEQTLEPSESGGSSEPDPADAWGWNEDDDSALPDETTDETAWDDPWSDAPPPTGTKVELQPPTPPPPISSPRAATRLEKLANKGKKNLNGNSPLNSPAISIHAPSSPLAQQSHSPAIRSPLPAQVSALKSGNKRPAQLTSLSVPKESYLVSSRMKEIFKIVEDVLNEGLEFTSSSIVHALESASVPGTVLLQTAASVLDLHRALYPVVFGAELRSSLQGPIRFSNNYLYLSQEIERLETTSPVAKERLAECRHRLKVLSETWLDDAIEQQRQAVDDILVEGAAGFTYTGDQDRYDECETAISQALKKIRNVSQQWKGIMTKSRYYAAIGSVTDAALSRVLEDVLALPDIPEVESNRLSELCRILNALEGLFVEDPTQPSFAVAYVPSWLKFSYLSELLEASMADITYLFEEGALVDFDVDELQKLVRALFADTALRATLITKLLGGHPVPAQ